MSKRFLFVAIVVLLVASTAGTALAQGGDDVFVNGDMLPDAPALAPRGPYGIGVQTMEVVNPDQLDILSFADGEAPLYDRPLTLEIWYPAVIPDGVDMLVEYEDVLGVANNPARPLQPYTYLGRALRDAAPDNSGGPYPLVIVSHGYPGSRLLLSYLTENLASKGYVVVAIDHTDSTYRDTNNFTSTLLNRSLDILFVLDQVAQLGAMESDSFLAGLVNAEMTALVGYSMGGYGALNAAGAGYSENAVGLFGMMSGGSDALAQRMTDNPQFIDSADPRIKAVVAFAPWGMERDLWDAEGLAGLTVPTLFVAGSQDDVAGYENGIKRLFEGAVNSDRTMLVYVNARHNVAPNPPAQELITAGIPYEEYMRFAEPAWNPHRINNINQHFLTAFLGIHLKGEAYEEYLDLVEKSNDGVTALDDSGNPTDDHTYWAGFLPRSAVGMELYHLPPQ